MLEFDQAVVEHQQGLIGPLPEKIRVMYRAKWMGVPAWELIKQDDCWSDWTDLLMEIEGEMRERNQSKT